MTGEPGSTNPLLAYTDDDYEKERRWRQVFRSSEHSPSTMAVAGLTDRGVNINEAHQILNGKFTVTQLGELYPELNFGDLEMLQTQYAQGEGWSKDYLGKVISQTGSSEAISGDASEPTDAHEA